MIQKGRNRERGGVESNKSYEGDLTSRVNKILLRIIFLLFVLFGQEYSCNVGFSSIRHVLTRKENLSK